MHPLKEKPTPYLLLLRWVGAGGAGNKINSVTCEDKTMPPHKLTTISLLSEKKKKITANLLLTKYRRELIPSTKGRVKRDVGNLHEHPFACGGEGVATKGQSWSAATSLTTFSPTVYRATELRITGFR